MVILALLRREDMYGYQLVQETEKKQRRQADHSRGITLPCTLPACGARFFSDRRVVDTGIYRDNPRCIPYRTNGGDREWAIVITHFGAPIYLPCSRKLKSIILHEIKGKITSYREENPDADYPQIESHFGMPWTIAAAYVDDMNTEELIHTLHIRKKW